MLLENFKLNSGSMPQRYAGSDAEGQELSCFDSCWYWSVIAESTIRGSENLPKLSYKQLGRDMELTLMNESAEHAFSCVFLLERAPEFFALPWDIPHH